MKGSKRSEPLQIKISPESILLLVAIILGLAFVYYLTSVVVTVFVAIILAALMEPVVAKLAEYRVPKALSVIGIYLVLFGLVVGFGALMAPPLITEIETLSEQYAPFLETVSTQYPILGDISSGDFFKQDGGAIIDQLKDLQLSTALTDGASSLLAIAGSLFGNLLAFFGMLVLALYLIVEPPKMNQKDAKSLLPEHWNVFMHDIAPKVQAQAGAWMRGQLLIMLIVFILSYLLLTALGVPFALVLAILAGLLEVIPFLGPNIAAIPAIIVGVSVSWPVAILVAVGYFLIQQVENHVLTPTVYKRVAGVNPVVTIVAILIGFELGALVGGNIFAGVLGGALALPFTVTAGVFLTEWLKWRSDQ